LRGAQRRGNLDHGLRARLARDCLAVLATTANAGPTRDCRAFFSAHAEKLFAADPEKRAVAAEAEKRRTERAIDAFSALYEATATIRTYVLISQDETRAMVYTRDADGRLGIQSAVLFEGVDASIEILEFGLALPFSVLYEGLGLAFDRTPTS
jgi:hypothetical protein